VLLALEDEEPEAAIEVFVAAADTERERAFALVTELRRTGIAADLDLAGRSMKGQMKQADRVGARRTVILDEEGARVRDMGSGEQRDLDLSRAVEVLSQ
jgi:histidyl-tRNA synthetase